MLNGFVPYHFELVRNRPKVSIVDYSNSEYKKELIELSSDNYNYENLSELLRNLREEGLLTVFFSIFCDQLPEKMCVLDDCIISEIWEALVGVEDQQIMNCIRISYLYHKLNDVVEGNMFCLILKEAESCIEGCDEEILWKFTTKVLITLIKVSGSGNAQSMVEFINRYFSLIFSVKLNVLSVERLMRVILIILDRFDDIAPSPEGVIAHPESCRLSSTLSIALLIGQINAILIGIASGADDAELELEALSEDFYVQTNFCLSYVLRKQIGFRELYGNRVVQEILRTVKLEQSTEMLNEQLEKALSRVDLYECNTLIRIMMQSDQRFGIEHSLLLNLLNASLRNLSALLYSKEYVKFVEMIRLTDQELELASSVHIDSRVIMKSLMSFIDLLILSPFVWKTVPYSWALELVSSVLEKTIQTYKTLLMDIGYLLSNDSLLASLYLLGRLVDHIKFTDAVLIRILKRSCHLLVTQSSQALRLVSKLWLEIANHLITISMTKTISFIYMALKFVNDCSMQCRKTSVSGCCYFLELLNLLLACPYFSITFCCFNDFLTAQLHDLELYKTNPAACYRLLECLYTIFDRHDSVCNTVFAHPSPIQSISISMLCLGCSQQSPYEQMKELSFRCLEKIKDCSIQRKINKIMKNRVWKTALGFTGCEAPEYKDYNVSNLLALAEAFQMTPLS